MSMSKLRSNHRWLLALLCCLALGLGGCTPRPRLTNLAAGSTVLAFGDSVTFGYGAAAGEDWPSLLARASGWKVINAGVSGDTAEAAGQRLPALLDEHRPALVIVELGGNDFLHHRAQKAVKEDLRRMLATIRAHGAQAVLVAVPEFSVGALITNKASDAPIYAELAQEEKLPLIADVFSQTLSRPELCSDKIHPNAQGYRQMAAGIQAALIKFGLLK